MASLPDVTPEKLPMHRRVTVVVATRDRRSEVLRALAHLVNEEDPPSAIVVDNGSSDGTVAAVRNEFADVEVIACGSNLGAVARNVGVSAATTPYVAFCDDDSWWEPGSLALAADVLDGWPEIALVAARVLVGDGDRLDDTSASMARSLLPPPPGFTGRAVLGFLACGAMVRRHAFLDIGGFDDVLFFLGEEEVLAYDLASRGWYLAYLEQAVVHHHPDAPRDPEARRALQTRNSILSAVMRRPWPTVWHRSGPALRTVLSDATSRRAIAGVLRRAPAALARRSPSSRIVERQLALLDVADGLLDARDDQSGGGGTFSSATIASASGPAGRSVGA